MATLRIVTDHDGLVQIAVRIALEAVDRGYRPFGALVAYGNQVVGTGMDISHSNGDPTDHAEICALRAALDVDHSRLVECAVYSSCEPCMMCTGAILRCGISAVYFAAPREMAAARGYPDVVSAKSLRATIPVTVTIRCLQAELGLAPFLAVENC